MHDPFNNLKQVMKETVFKDVSFSDERKNAVKETINQSPSPFHSWKIETIIAILVAIQHVPMHGYAISTHLFQKNDLIFQNKEGELYTLLHLLENKNILTSKWDGDKKYYTLTSKGKKHLAGYRQGNVKRDLSLKQLIEEVSF
ncbi:PadR family transcriptional regulator [Salipaludibacillus agaradhaerens]|uniref:PadR family transcriptional regulator n=1 Tax=Salipaludibacillus agaradhaerens TaxID=76935 RepID=UPI0021519B13|nr:PadR family transcriptional regulator [Salipaludibacillus agaradhaerens]MCR6105678.1 PadR family transcriptional regulator [Salipaludibacillus agaradhaerens]MCR6117715.1 PadR family transcriptional regulator [Salipaludibacillus agaradhaerens]UJW56889.1 PadR family transcriptional regulator [Bacillus sp. A116_S68]